jgi:hypothetical protein
MFLTVRRNVPMGKPYDELYGVDRTSRKGAAQAQTYADPKRCFASQVRVFAEQWLRGHLPPDIAGAAGN